MNHSYSSGPYETPLIRQYAVVIYLPPHLDQIIHPLREKYDPDYNKIPAHVTLMFPSESTRPVEELAQIIRQEVIQMEPTTLKLDSVGDFYPEAPVIYWSIEDNDSLSRLYLQLHAQLDLPLPFKDFIPHVTAAREISTHRVVLVKDKLASYLPAESFKVKAVDLVSPVAGNQWVSVRTFPVPE